MKATITLAGRIWVDYTIELEDRPYTDDEIEVIMENELTKSYCENPQTRPGFAYSFDLIEATELVSENGEVEYYI